MHSPDQRPHFEVGWGSLRTFVTWLVAALCILSGCASALPAFSGASTTPQGRGDIGFGGAARIPTGDLKSIELAGQESGYRQAIDAGGIVPVAYARYGLSRDWDAGLMVAGTTARASFRKERLLVDGSTRSALVFELAPYGGAIVGEGDSGSGARIGIDVPIVYGIEFGSLYEFSFGPRLGLEYAWGDFAIGTEKQHASALGLKGGLVLGMAIGVRRIHAIVEITAAWEQWFAEQGGESLNRGGIVLTPAFAMRLRL